MTIQYPKINNSKNITKIIKKLFFILLGDLLCALAFNVFFIPSKLLSGGVGGLGIIIQYLTGIPTGISVFFMNLPIIVIGAQMVDKEFVSYAFISMFIFSFFLTITNGVSEYFIIDDVLLSAVFGAVLNGLGMGLMFRNRTCQGGLDIIAAILKKKYNLNISTGLMTVNTVIISLSSLLFGYKSAMYTLISLYLGYKILDKVQTGFNVKKNIVIVSDKSQELADSIIQKLHRGVTFLEGMGGYTKENKKVIYCIITSSEVVKLKNLVEEIDPSAFLTINDVVEVKGSSFQNVGI
ncbi:YitT family protein [Proteiniborus sp. MB09-C3]|uniref:YitT family protein n=1 Tax=Proteiniborus sp. MB09-C3 TaxID=3050072 RepID=UPI002553C418|nr:YitT family protein [Proteiniborus sp. MB09-C3]WIV11480.1 YitT family protein [Proteiniborus sp. MB09-C3]